MTDICRLLYDRSSDGAALYFMQREKNAEYVLASLRQAGWTFQNLIIWKKLTSAVPSTVRFGKHFQVIVFATKGKRPRVFNRLRIDPPLPANYKHARKNGMYVTDVWDDIRELTSGYFAGDEALRTDDGDRFHKQQAPIALLLRIILASTKMGDRVCDPFAGTGTTLVVAKQLKRAGIGMELDPQNVTMIQQRLDHLRTADDIQRYRDDYQYTPDLDAIWDTTQNAPREERDDVFDLPLFRQSNPDS